MKKTVTFGEIMLRLKTPEHLRIVQTDGFEASYGGAEANVAVSLAVLKDPVSFVTKLPDNPVGTAALNEVRRLFQGLSAATAVILGNELGAGKLKRAEKYATQFFILQFIVAHLWCLHRTLPALPWKSPDDHLLMVLPLPQSPEPAYTFCPKVCI